MIVIDAEAVQCALPFDRLVAALRTQFAVGCEVPARHVHEIASPDGGSVDTLTSLIMPAWTVGRYYGVKLINIAPGNAKRGLPALHASYLLHDAATGVPLALIDGDELTARRTVAASALAASFLARRDARHLLVVGAGRIARLLADAHRAVRPIEQVSVWARRHDQAEKLAAKWRGEGRHAEAVHDIASAATDADIVSCATLATEPVMRGRWLRAGSHLDLIGSFTPAMREADDDCFAGARCFVDTDEALRKSGDLLGPLSRGVISPQSLQGTLESLCRGEAIGRRGDDERTVFKSVGTALEDLAAAVLVYETVTDAER